MKKIYLLSAAVLSILAAASCAKEENGPETFRTVISASIAPTKTALGEKDGDAWPNYWKAGDQISVNGVASEALGTEFDGKANATFSFDGLIATPYNAVYPASAVSGYSDGSATVTLPASQKYVAGSYDPAAFIMGGKSTDQAKVTLSPCVSVIHLSLTGTASISKVKLAGAPGSALSGSFTTDFSTYAPKAVSNEVEMTPETPVALPAEFFICVPAGLSGAINVEVFDAEGGSMSKNATLKSALAPGQMYSPAALAYTASYDITITAEGITSSTAVICWDNSPEAAYTIGVYSDEGGTNLIDSYSVDAGNACWSGQSPRFCISGLDSGTTYYVKVTNATKNVDSNILAVTTEDFEIVQVSSTPAEEGDVILAEDFSELRWDCDMIGVGAGWFPTDEAQTSFSTIEVASFQAAATSNEKQLSSPTNALAGSRLMHWAQGAKPNMYIHPGYIKLVGNSQVTHLVTPALDNIPEGMAATLEVEVTASRYYSASSDTYATDKAIVAVQPAGEYNELLSKGVNTLDLESNIASITLPAEVAWNTYKVTLSNVSKGDRLAFGADKSVTKNEARMNISDMKVTIKQLYEPGTITLSLKEVSSSTASFTWTHVGSDAAYDISKPYLAAIYSDSACSNLVASYEIPAESSCWDGKQPSFVFSGLTPSTNYWCKVTDMSDSMESEAVSCTTSAFTVVDATTVTNAAVGDVILAEDFSEIGWGAEELTTSAGFYPAAPKTLYVPSGAYTTEEGSFSKYNGQSGRVFGDARVDSDKRLYHWGFFGNSSVYAYAAYLRVGTGDSGARTHIVTPALVGIPADKKATIDVTVTAGQYADNANDVAVFVESDEAMSLVLAPDQNENSNFSSRGGKYNGASLSKGYPLNATTRAWTTSTVRIPNVTNDTRLLIGSFENNDKKNRFFLSDVVVTLVELKDPGTVDIEVDIQDFDTFKAFLEACEPGKTVKGNVINDITLTSGQVAEIDALYPVAEFDGILNGNNHTIAGLTKPLFGELSGKVSDLTLNSSLSITSAMNNIGILACSANNATISGCITNGSITLNYASGVDGDLSIGGLVGLNNGGTMTGCVNNASVTNNSSSTGEMHIGGIAGISFAELESCSNTGDITNNGSTDTKEINVAGITAFCCGDITSCSNAGTISNTATSGTSSIQDLQVGGIVANVKDPGYTLTSCFNTGAISNSGAASTVSIGGIAAWSTKGTFVTCYNSGALTNSGIGSNEDAACAVRIGGIVGSASQANTLSGDADNYNYNEGTILENSESERITIGGICGWANNDGTSMDYAQNKATGDITISGGTRYYTYVGGILGCNSAAPSFSYTKNAGDINFSEITVSKAVYAGGIHGGFLANGSHTITGCENTGAINCPDSGGASNNMKSTSGASVVTYIGGISSGSGDGAARTSKVFTNCINRGAITVFNQLWTRLGGCLGYANKNAPGCENHGKIVYYRKSGGYTSGNGAVGGVIGYINIASVSDLTNTGGVQSTGSSPNCYTGGIVGQEGGNMNTMTNCYVGNPGGSAINIVGAGSGSFGSTGAGLFVASNSAKAWTFTGCKVISGTKCQSTVITDDNMADAVVGRKHATSITDAPTLVDSF